MENSISQVGLISIYTIVVVIIGLFVLSVILTRTRVILRYSSGPLKRVLGSPMLAYTLRRVASGLLSLFLAVIVTFLLLRANYKPEQFCEGLWPNITNQTERNELCTNLINRMGYTGTMFDQTISFIGKIIPFPKLAYDMKTGIADESNAFWTLIDFGNGFRIGSTNLEDHINNILPGLISNSFKIGIIGFIVTEVLGYPMGVLMAKYKDKMFDKIGNGAIIVVFSIPTVVFYYLLSQFFSALGLPLLYSDSDPISILAPGLVLGLGAFWSTALWVRRYMVDEFGAEYVKFARSKGIPENKIMYKHVLRNAIIPLVRSFPASILYCLTGSFFVEKIYGVSNGIGYQLFNGLTQQNFPMIQAIVIFSAFVTVISTVSGDILTAICDPRITLTAKKA